MILLSILVFIVVGLYFVGDSAELIREYPTLEQLYGQKKAIKTMWLDLIFWGVKLVILVWVFILWVV